jgi:hypothetical protein
VDYKTRCSFSSAGYNSTNEASTGYTHNWSSEIQILSQPKHFPFIQTNSFIIFTCPNPVVLVAGFG